MQPKPVIQTELFTSSELLKQPWLPKLTRMINESYLVSHTDKIKFDPGKIRLKSDSELSDELGSDGFTAVAFSDGDVVGTASMKPWKDESLWKPLDHFATDAVEDQVNDRIDQILNEVSLPGDYELAVVALPPTPQIRGKGIAGRLVKICEEEVLRRRRATGDNKPVRIMIRVIRENLGDYWRKQGFVPVGAQAGPKAWETLDPFVMWAMIRELSPQ
ncbi:uncharacterized protein N7498_005531 [Penicillium cinerascens]|uniref:N-acetyltransferase domain-containing protein n=1 Tax=Penicillium cinerascens TaxID=70096 RepID=A0A9W9MNZ3_9EURO|nr:uncharacterized protein N7498_005531 [Penicillium cinerascens]KAJ5204652.1 hypothetical protein N7498_005531 [Penicillium cinerascens]